MKLDIRAVLTKGFVLRRRSKPIKLFRELNMNAYCPMYLHLVSHGHMSLTPQRFSDVSVAVPCLTRHLSHLCSFLGGEVEHIDGKNKLPCMEALKYSGCKRVNSEE